MCDISTLSDEEMAHHENLLVAVCDPCASFERLAVSVKHCVQENDGHGIQEEGKRLQAGRRCCVQRTSPIKHWLRMTS
jgi:hypothetical protein